MSALGLQQQKSVAATEAMWSTEPQIFTGWPSAKKKFACCFLETALILNVLQHGSHRSSKGFQNFNISALFVQQIFTLDSNTADVIEQHTVGAP